MKRRIDHAVVQQGLCATRSQAENWIRLGKVLVNGTVINKPGYFVADTAKIELRAPEKYVSRAGLNEPLQLPFTNLDTQKSISGRCIGMLGSTIITDQDNDHYLLPLGKLTGYRLTFSEQTTPNTVGPKQITLF